MYKFIFVFLVSLLSTVFKPSVNNDSADITLCHAPMADGMVAFVNQKEFQMAHPIPGAFLFKSLAGGEMISINTTDGQTAQAFLIKAKKKTNNYLFVYQEWWGLNDHIKAKAEEYYNELGGNVNVLAIDMYEGKVATTREEAGKLMGGAKPERLEAIMTGASNYAGEKAKIASVGWCFGGGLSLKSALIEGQKAVGCVIYYGMPVKDVEKLKTLQCDVLGIFAGREKWISPEVVKEFDANMKTAGKSLNYKIFDAEHGFSNPSNPIYDKTATAEAYAMSSSYLKKAFGI